MNAVASVFSRIENYLSTMGASDVADILIVTYLIYQCIMLVRRTNLYNVAKGLIIFVLATWISDILNLTMITYLLRKAGELGLIALVVLFQPELRRLLERVGSSFFGSSSKSLRSSEVEEMIRQTAQACADMSAAKTGALLVFERKIRLNDVITSGTPVDSAVSAELIKNLFFNKAPLHDGAVVIREGRIAAAGCILPLTTNQNLNKELGTRHRAGIGMSEQSDAVVLIVSEESGSISCSIDGNLKRHMDREALEKLLREELSSQDPQSGKKSIRKRIAEAFAGLTGKK